MVSIRDFNAWSSTWCNSDKSNYKRTKIDCSATEYDLKKVIHEPIHLLELGNSSSCIDLIFTSQPNLVMDTGVHPSLNAHCHHQIVYANFNLKILSILHPLKERFGIFKKLISILLEGRWMNLIGKGFFFQPWYQWDDICF